MRLIQRKAALIQDPIRNCPQEVFEWDHQEAAGKIEHLIETYAVKVVAMVVTPGKVIVVFEEDLS